MNIKNQTGFTLVEVMIVLAVSSLLASSVLVWQGSVNEHAKYSDAMEDVTSRLSEMRGQVYATLNESIGRNCDDSSSSVAGTNKDCVVFGKAMQFDAGGPEQISERTFVASKTGVFDDDIVGVNEIGLMERSHQLKWGIEFVEGELVDTGEPVDTIVMVRNFNNGDLETYSLDSSDDLTEMANYVPSARRPAEFRFTNDKGREATLHVNESSNSIRRSLE